MKPWRRKPDFIIGPEDDPYLLRWWLLPRNRLLNVYLHKFLRDDDDRALHDHPWPSLSIVVSGGYFEITPGPDGTFQRRWYRPGKSIWRRPRYSHRVELFREPDGTLRPCKTLFITGPRVREWGFHCPKGWVHWKDFVDENDFGNTGKGCPE